jgi:hypothetical protein
LIGLRLLGLLLITCGMLVAALCAPCTIMGVDLALHAAKPDFGVMLIVVWGIPMAFGLITIGVGGFLLFGRRPEDGDRT